MDEKDAIQRIKNSKKANHSDAKIITNFQKKGYTVAYAAELIRKAKKPRRLWLIALVCLVLIALVGLIGYLWYENSSLKDNLNSNRATSSSSHSSTKTSVTAPTLSNGFVKQVLVSMDALKYLHRNVLFEKPAINFVLVDKSFHAVLTDEVVVSAGLLEGADLQFSASQETVDSIFSSDDPYGAIGTAIASGSIEIERLVSDAELFSKGYASWYDSFS